MKIRFLGPRKNAKGPYSFPKLGVAGLHPGELYDVPDAAGGVLIKTFLAEEVHDEPVSSASPSPAAEEPQPSTEEDGESGSDVEAED